MYRTDFRRSRIVRHVNLPDYPTSRKGCPECRTGFSTSRIVYFVNGTDYPMSRKVHFEPRTRFCVRSKVHFELRTRFPTSRIVRHVNGTDCPRSREKRLAFEVDVDVISSNINPISYRTGNIFDTLLTNCDSIGISVTWIPT